MPLNFQYAFILVAAGALLVPGPIRRVGLIGLVPLALAIAATSIRLGDGLTGLALRAAERAAPLGFLQINTGLFLLGSLLVAVAVVGGLAQHPSSPTAWFATLLAMGGVAPGMVAQIPLLTYIGWLPAAGAALGIGAGGVTLFILGRLLRIGRALAWIDQRVFDRGEPAGAPVAALRVAVVAVAALLLIWLRSRSPEGMDFWAPLFMPLTVIAVWHVAASPGIARYRRRRAIELLLALACLGILAGGAGVVGGYWLLAGAVLLPWILPLLSTAAGRLLWLPMAWGALQVLAGGLATQVTYSVLAAGGIAAAIQVYHTPE